MGTQKLREMYRANTLAQSCACRKHMDDMDDPLEGCHDFAVILSKSSKGRGLMLENVHDRVDGMAILELASKRMVDQFQSCLFFIALEGSVEKRLKPGTRRIVHCMIQMEEVCEEAVEK